MEEYLTNKYLISLLGSLMAFLATYMYDKFEKKEYSYAVYAKMMILGYVISVGILAVFQMIGSGSSSMQLPNVVDVVSNTSQAVTGSQLPAVPQPVPSTVQTTSARVGSGMVSRQAPNIPLDQLRFKIGSPAF
jgi:predicted PurR-regulated permease PerM